LTADRPVSQPAVTERLFVAAIGPLTIGLRGEKLPVDFADHGRDEVETLTIESKDRLSLDALAERLSQRWRIESSPGNTLTVHGEKSRVYLYPDVELTEQRTHLLLVDYSEVALVKSVVELIADDRGLMVDNDFGTVLPGDEFVARCRFEEGWDWRR
jgi:hypothetical protein